MGWTTTSDYEHQRSHRLVKGIADYIGRNVLTWQNERSTNRVLHIVKVGSTCYAACEQTCGGKTEVWAAIVLTSYMPGDKDGHTLGWKEMSEESGPYQCDAPLKLLDMLSETTNANALEWRAACRENHARRASGRKAQTAMLRAGAWVRSQHPIKFSNGKSADLFEVLKGRNGRGWLFRTMDGTIYKISPLSRKGMTVAEEPADMIVQRMTLRALEGQKQAATDLATMQKREPERLAQLGRALAGRGHPLIGWNGAVEQMEGAAA